MKTAKPYAEALALAEELLAILAPVCERIEIAGSLRRRKVEIGDIELVAHIRSSHPDDALRLACADEIAAGYARQIPTEEAG